MTILTEGSLNLSII